MSRRTYTQEEYEREAQRLERTIVHMLDGGTWPVRVKRSCMFGDPKKIAERARIGCVFWNHRDTEPEYVFTYTPEQINELVDDGGRLIFRVLRRGPIESHSLPVRRVSNEGGKE